MDHTFRNAVFGGFNRQDVLTYLELTAQEAANEQTQLNQKLEAAQEAAARQDEELSARQAQLDGLEEEVRSLREQLEQANTDLSNSRSACSRTEEELEAARQELALLKARIAQLEPDAQAYAAVKERTAGVELDAHRRAQAVQDAADEYARRLRCQMEQWIRKVEGEYDSLRTQVESTVSHAAAQLEKAGQSLEQVNLLLGQQEMELQSLAQDYAATAPDKAAAPQPILEEVR